MINLSSIFLKTFEIWYNKFLKICLTIVIVSIITVKTASSDTVELKFLKGVNRLNSSNHFDYYFSCSVVGRYLYWQYNHDQLRGLHRLNAIGKSGVFETDNYVYTVSLLSSEPVENYKLAMDSLLIMSFTNETAPSDFTVTCSNGPDSKTESAGSEVSTMGTSARSSDGSSIVLDYIISKRIAKKRTTHIFMCGTQHSPQILQANGPPISFLSTNPVGSFKAPAVTFNAITELGVFIAQSPFMITSVMIVVDESNVSVTCSSGPHRAIVQSQSQVPPYITTTVPGFQFTVVPGSANSINTIPMMIGAAIIKVLMILKKLTSF